MVVFEEGAGKFQGVGGEVVRVVWERLPDDPDSFFAAFVDEFPADDVAGGIGVAAGDESGEVAHARCRFVKHAAGVGSPCPASAGVPCGEEVACLASGGVAVEEDFCGADVVTFLQLAEGLLEGFAGPLLGFPVFVVFETGGDEENAVGVAPLAPSEASGGVGFAVGVASAEDDEDAVAFASFGLVSLGDAELKDGGLVFGGAGFDLDLSGAGRDCEDSGAYRNEAEEFHLISSHGIFQGCIYTYFNQ